MNEHTIDVNELAACVRKGIDASRKSSSKWEDLYEWLSEHFDIPADKIRASLLADPGNITNRVFKDNAWENPEVIVLVCVEKITPDVAARYVDEFVGTFHSRLGVLPRLRAALIFEDDQLVKVKKLTTRSPAMEPGGDEESQA